MTLDFASETRARLEQYVVLLNKWNAAINLVSQETLADVWTRHIEDSAQLASYIGASRAPGQTLADLGSGAGFPGMVLAILCPHIAVTLIERDQRKCSFLREAARILAVPNVVVQSVDAREITATFSLITARALAPLDKLLHLAYPLSTADTKCYFPKGQNFAMELTEAQRHWVFACRAIPSITSEASVVLEVSSLTAFSAG